MISKIIFGFFGRSLRTPFFFIKERCPLILFDNLEIYNDFTALVKVVRRFYLTVKIYHQWKFLHTLADG
jgi:hypothetical protein